MSTISERLKAWAMDMQVGRNCFGADQDLIEAADAIDELVATLTELRSRYHGLFNVYVGRSYHSKADAQDDLDLALTGTDTVLAKHNGVDVDENT